MTLSGFSMTFKRTLLMCNRNLIKLITHHTLRFVLIFISLVYLLKLLVRIFKYLKDFRVKMFWHCPAVAFGYYFRCFFMVNACLIGAWTSYGIILVNNIHYPTFYWNFLALKPFWITTPIPSFMVT